MFLNNTLLWCIVAFLVGAIPFGFLAGKLYGKDLREEGSGNIGATNTLRVLGKRAGITVLLLDALKGFLPVFLALRHLPGATPESGGWSAVLVGFAAVFGHIYSPYVRFRGGKGVATALGVLIGLSPLIALSAFAVFFVTVYFTRYVSLGSILGALTQAVLFWVVPGQSVAARLFGTIVGLFVVLRHRGNIQRLRNGTESKFGRPSSSPEPPATEAGGEGESPSHR
jgi:acyl-phosphate glycerol 3-phosphate acyltransferase